MFKIEFVELRPKITSEPINLEITISSFFEVFIVGLGAEGVDRFHDVC